MIMRGKKAFGHRYRRLTTYCLLAVLLLCCLNRTQRVEAQQKYTPEHPVVVEMVERAIKALETMSRNTASGYQVLSALAIIETSKRYESLVPTDHPIVTSAVDVVLKELESGVLAQSDSIYYPSLALILLCDCGTSRYEKEIKSIIKILVDRQKPFGAYTYRKFDNRPYGDTSQTQYVGLALWVAHKRGFALPVETPGKALQFYLDVHLPNGSWSYEYDNGRPRQSQTTLSIHAASLGTVYLLADFLQLNPRARRTAAEQKKIAEEVEYGVALPPSVSVYVPPDKDGFQPIDKSSGPLFRIDRAKLGAVKASANKYMADNYEVFLNRWGYYYLYAFERYAFFREKAEGSVKEIPDWYDRSVEFLLTRQKADGSFPANQSGEQLTDSTCFSILFLVRSSEVLVPVGGEGNLNGSVGLPSNVRIDLVDGKVKTFNVIKGLDDVLQLLGDENLDEQQYELIKDSLASSIGKLSDKQDRNQREYLNYMRGLVSDRNYFKRLFAVKLLSRQQDMDNVPPLIYALGDPDLRICAAAHNGLRLISRKLDSIRVNGEPGYAEYQRVKQEWTEWFLKIRPGATLLD